MNRENIEATIAIMDRAQANNSLSMSTWQSRHITMFGKGMFGIEAPVATDEVSFHQCGNTACLAGHIAVSPEFQSIGGYVGMDGEPLFPGMSDLDLHKSAPMTMTRWFGFTHADLATLLIVDREIVGYIDDGGSNFINHTNSSNLIYGVPWISIQPQNVNRVLREILDNGEDAFRQRVIGDLYKLFQGEKQIKVRSAAGLFNQIRIPAK